MGALRICDLHCDTGLLWQAGSSLQDTSLHVSLPHLIEGQVGLQVFAAYVPASLPKDRCFSFVRQTIDRIIDEIEGYPAQIVLCRNSREVVAARRQGRIAALLAVENGDAIEEDLQKLRQLHGMGVRLMTLIHTRSNAWVVSSKDENPGFAGLSPFGEEVVEAMNELGMIIDVSHVHERAVERVLECSNAPIVASHSCMHGLCPIPRNIKDELIRAIAAGGGLVGINFQPAFLDCSYRERGEKKVKAIFSALDRMTEKAGSDPVKLGQAWMKFTKDFKNTMATERLPLDKLLDQFDYLVDLVGEDVAAFGSDFDGIPDTPVGVEDCRGFNNIIRGLRERGYSRERLEKICWSNFFGVLKTVCG
ncbi:MAG: dipeptidase [Spirochaetaceae bacterium]|nr:MAG: dipeptidase [Spirochaetaceae bacterium]